MLFSVLVDVAIRVEPAFVQADEAAGFVEAVGASADLVAGDEFNDGMGWVRLLMAFDLQAEPLGRGIAGEVQFDGAEIRMPGGEQVILPPEGEGAVAGAHQCFGGGGGQAVVEVAAAAAGVVGRGAARAGRGHEGERGRQDGVAHFRLDVPRAARHPRFVP